MLTIAALAYGVNIPYARLAGDLGVSGPNAVALRVLCVLPLFAGAALIGGVSLNVRGEERARLFWLGVTCAFTGLGYLSSIAFVPVGVAVMIFYTFPLIILLLSPFVDKARLGFVELIAFALAFTGIALAIGPSFQTLDWRGLVLAFVASLGAAAQFFLAARAPGGGGLATLFWIHAIVLPVALLASFINGGPPRLSSLEAAVSPLVITTLLYVLGVVLQIRGLRLISASAAGLIFCLEPIVATLSAGLLLGERLSLLQYAGGALVLCAIVFNIVFGAARREPG